jgi:8-oxo-dGTP diphosphatase
VIQASEPPTQVHNPPLPTIGVSAFVFDDDERVLLVRRGQAPARGQWHPPGGKLEPGESLTEACRREVKEETGLNVVVGPIIAVVERRLEGFHYVIIDLFAMLEDPAHTACVPADDVLAVEWVSSARLTDYDTAEGLLPILERARRMRRGEKLGLHDETGNGTDFIPAAARA